MSGARLTVRERGALIFALSDAIGPIYNTVEAIIAARLAPVEALALHDAADALEGGLGVDGTPRDLYEFRLWLRTRAAALSQPTAAPSPDREPEPTPSEES